MRLLTLVLILLTSLPALAHADSWMAFGTQRMVSSSGKRYVVVVGDTLSYVLRERRDGVAPLGPARGRAAAEEPADRMLGKGKLPHLPMELIPLDREPAVLLYERYAALGADPTLALMTADGAVRWSVTFSALFSAEVRKTFTRSTSSTWYMGRVWVDEGRGKAVLLSGGGTDTFDKQLPLRVREVDLKTGALRQLDGAGAADEALLAGVALPNAGASARAYAAAIIRKPAGLLAYAKRTAADASLSLGARLRAASAAAELAGVVADPTLVTSGLAAERSQVTRLLALELLPKALGAKGLPHLARLLRDREQRRPIHRATQAAFVSLGDAAVPTLSEILNGRREHPPACEAAARALAQIGTDKAVAALEGASVSTSAPIARLAGRLLDELRRKRK